MSKLITIRKGYNKARGLSVRMPDFIPGSGNIFETQGLMNTPNFAKWDRLASDTYGLNYGNPNYTLNDYMYGTNKNLGNYNWFGISKAKNPLSKGNLNTTMTAVANTATPIVGSIIGQGYHSDVGDTIGTVGSTVGGALSTVNPALGTAVTIGSQIVGLGYNLLAGEKVDEKALQEAQAGTNYLNNFVSNASDFGDVQGIQAQKAIGNVYKGGIFNTSADEKNQDLLDARLRGLDWADRSLRLNIDNIWRNKINDYMGHYVALGGPIEVDPSTAIGYSLYTDDYVRKNNKDNSNMTNMFTGVPGSMFAFGGNAQTNSANFSTGLTHIDAGGSHEENPNDGVLVGVDSLNIPNLVEEGEVIYTDEDYVFSNRLRVPRGKRGNYGKRNKYAKGGKLSKGREAIEIPYEQQVLRPFEGMTFADAAKKAEKLSGVTERFNDPIAQRGFKSTLEVLKGVQEKEREKEKLQEMQEAIDNMSPEEFAMLLQQMQASQELQALQEALAQLQQMIPQGMEQMVPEELMISAYGGPIYKLGGVLNTPDNMYPYGGSLELFLKDLQAKGLTLLDYLTAFPMEEGTELTDGNFDKNNAEKYLKKVDELTKKYNRIAKRKKVDASKLTGRAKVQYNNDLRNAILKGMSNPEYKMNEDLELSLNANTVKGIDSYNNVATYNNLVASGAAPIDIDDQGRVKWSPTEGLTRIDNTADNFYANLDLLNEEALQGRGIYNYTKNTPSSISDYDLLKLYGWSLGDDDKYAVNNEIFAPNESSIIQGNNPENYQLSALGSLQPDAEGYTDAVKAIQDTLEYQDLTKYVLDAIRAADGDINKLPSDIKNYLQYLDANTGDNNTKKLLTKNDKGDITGINKNAAELYNARRNDNKYGIYHYQFDRGLNESAVRYFYTDPKTGNKVYVARPGDNSGFTIKDTPELDGIFNDYEITGLDKTRKLINTPQGVLDVTDINPDEFTPLDKPVYQDNTDDLGYGVTGTTNWVDFNKNNPALTTENEPFPKMPTWPYMAGIGLQLGSLGYNILSPADYSNADAMIAASLKAGRFDPIHFKPIPYHIGYKPDDPWFYTSPIISQSNTAIRNTNNKISPSNGAENAANLYNTVIGLGNAQRQQLEHNFDKEFKVAGYQTGVDTTNSEGFLKAAMSNQDAALKARGFNLEGLRSGYAMRQAIDDAKANAISAGISGVGNMLYNMADANYKNKLLGWGIKHNAWAPLGSAKGGKIKRRKGLNF